MAVQDKFRRGQIAGAKETVMPTKKSVTEWEGKYPEIAKAVGAQRGGKYLKRIPKPGGGYRYVYRETKQDVAAAAFVKLKGRWSPEAKAGAVRAAMKKNPKLKTAQEIANAAKKELPIEGRKLPWSRYGTHAAKEALPPYRPRPISEEQKKINVYWVLSTMTPKERAAKFAEKPGRKEWYEEGKKLAKKRGLGKLRTR